VNVLLERIFGAQSRKAWGSGIVAFLGAMQLVMLSKGYTSVTQLDQMEWISVAITVLGSFGITYNLSNDQPEVPFNDNAVNTPMWVDTTHDVPATLNVIGTSGVERDERTA
jgi:hypothetical protein